MGLQRRKLGLSGALVPRTQPRLVDQRSEPRHEDLVERAVLLYRGGQHLVSVVNLSSRGTMVEIDIVPRIGEAVIVLFEGCSPIHAFVRWARDGRIGLNFGHEILLG